MAITAVKKATADIPRSSENTYCVLAETGAVVGEQKLSTTPKAVKDVLAAMSRSRVAIQTGTHSPWVSRLLKELGHDVIVHMRVMCTEPAFGWPYGFSRWPKQASS